MIEPNTIVVVSILRIVCGVFFIPHVIGKITQRQAAIDFFTLAGLKPVESFLNIALTLDLLLGVGLISGKITKYLPWIAMVYLLVCAAAVIRVERKWLWHIGGCEYPVFWAICCGLVGYSQWAP